MKQTTLDQSSPNLSEESLKTANSNELSPPIALPPYLIVANTIMLTLFVAFVIGFGRYLFRVLLPEMRADIGFDYGTAGILNAMVAVGYFPDGDRFG